MGFGSRTTDSQRPGIGIRPLASLKQWQLAALLKDRTRRAIRDRARAGEPVRVIAADYGVPVMFVRALAGWQLFEDGSNQKRPVGKRRL
jgi:hypothetical protein